MVAQRDLDLHEKTSLAVTDAIKLQNLTDRDPAGITNPGTLMFGHNQRVAVTGNKTLAAADQGIIQQVNADGAVITLPATAAGLVFIIQNIGEDGDVGINVDPAAADQLIGNGFTPADDKDAINTKATAKKGDYIIVQGNGTTGYHITHVGGTWAREA
jgi:hypothetical protein